MNPGRYEQAVEPLRGRPADIRAHGVADGENAGAIGDGPPRGGGAAERAVVDGRIGFAGLYDVAAEALIALGDRPAQ